MRPKDAYPFCLWCALAEAEKQNDHGDQDDPKQNVFAEKIACTVHNVSPFIVAGVLPAHFQFMNVP